MTAIYFPYSTHKAREAAEMALEDYFATGEIREGEFPKIERRPNGRWAVMFPGC